MEITPLQLADLVTTSIKVALKASNAEKPDLSYNGACDRYGRRKVDRWLRAGIVKKRKDNGRYYISLVELEVANDVINRPLYALK